MALHPGLVHSTARPSLLRPSTTRPRTRTRHARAMEKAASVTTGIDVVPELAPADPAMESDQRLRELGYKSEFRRDMSLFGVLGISFCAIGILTGMSSAFQTG